MRVNFFCQPLDSYSGFFLRAWQLPQRYLSSLFSDAFSLHTPLSSSLKRSKRRYCCHIFFFAPFDGCYAVIKDTDAVRDAAVVVALEVWTANGCVVSRADVAVVCEIEVSCGVVCFSTEALVCGRGDSVVALISWAAVIVFAYARWRAIKRRWDGTATMKEGCGRDDYALYDKMGMSCLCFYLHLWREMGNRVKNVMDNLTRTSVQGLDCPCPCVVRA